MNLIKCPNNHFYDADKYAQCPHCLSAGRPAPSVSPQAIAEKDLHTVALNQNFADNGQRDVLTVPAENPRPASGPGIGDAETVPLQPVGSPTPGVDVIPPLDDPFPTFDVPGDDLPTSDDDEHTIGYYNSESELFEESVQPVVGWLVILNGKMKGESVNIYSGRSFIGRGDENDIVLKGDKTVSRQKHAVIVFEPKGQIFLLQPGSSRELFYLNGEVVLDTQKLKEYDKIEIGKTELLFIPLCGDKFSWNDTNQERGNK